MSIYTIDASDALAEEIVSAVVLHIGRAAERAYDAEGDLAGITYYAAETARYYAASLIDLERYIATVQRREDGDAYSIWCAETDSSGESKAREETLAGMGWHA